jgi:hypothetical protein
MSRFREAKKEARPPDGWAAVAARAVAACVDEIRKWKFFFFFFF